jgi:hypothetical protein
VCGLREMPPYVSLGEYLRSPTGVSADWSERSFSHAGCAHTVAVLATYRAAPRRTYKHTSEFRAGPSANPIMIYAIFSHCWGKQVSLWGASLFDHRLAAPVVWLRMSAFIAWTQA